MNAIKAWSTDEASQRPRVAVRRPRGTVEPSNGTPSKNHALPSKREDVHSWLERAFRVSVATDETIQWAIKVARKALDVVPGKVIMHKRYGTHQQLVELLEPLLPNEFHDGSIEVRFFSGKIHMITVRGEEKTAKWSQVDATVTLTELLLAKTTLPYEAIAALAWSEGLTDCRLTARALQLQLQRHQ